VLVQKAGAKTTQLANLIQRLLDFTQIENRTFQMNLQKEACYVEDIIGQALKDLDEEFQSKNISLERALMSGLTGAMRWRDIEVTRDPAGAPGLAVSGFTGEALRARGLVTCSLSLSHTASHAVAVVLIAPA
jgi:holo-[acyl-carrier protein] synthase